MRFVLSLVNLEPISCSVSSSFAAMRFMGPCDRRGTPDRNRTDTFRLKGGDPEPLDDGSVSRSRDRREEPASGIEPDPPGYKPDARPIELHGHHDERSPRPESNRILPCTRRVLDRSSCAGKVLAVRAAPAVKREDARLARAGGELL